MTNTKMRSSEITKEAALALIGNDEYTWCDFETSEHCERSFYKCHGVMIIVVFTFIGSITQYYVQDINA